MMDQYSRSPMSAPKSRMSLTRSIAAWQLDLLLEPLQYFTIPME